MGLKLNSKLQEDINKTFKLLKIKFLQMEKYNCKITGKKIKKIINFGKMPIANGFLKKKGF